MIYAYYSSKIDEINLQMDFSRFNASFRHASNCLSLIEMPPGFSTRHISPLHVAIVINDVANSSSSASGSANTVFLLEKFRQKTWLFACFILVLNISFSFFCRALTHQISWPSYKLGRLPTVAMVFGLFYVLCNCWFLDHTVFSATSLLIKQVD